MPGSDKVLDEMEKQVVVAETLDARERKPTEKGGQYKPERIAQHERAFQKAYTVWKGKAKASRSQLKDPYSEEQLADIKTDVEQQFVAVQEEYEALKKLYTSTSSIVQRMDTCGHLTKEISDLIEPRRSNPSGEAQGHLQREKVRMTLNKEKTPSVFGCSVTDAQISEASRQMAEADLAAKSAELEAMHAGDSTAASQSH